MAENAYLRAIRFLESGRIQDAEPYLRKAIEEDPSNSGIHYLLSCCLSALPDKRKEALHCIDQALSMEPVRADYHLQRARILLNMQNLRAAETELTIARSLDPDLEAIRVVEAAFFLTQGKPREAESAARAALQADPDNEIAATQLAYSLRLQGRMIENAEQIRQMLARRPDNPRHHATAGWAALQSGKTSEAESHFMEALRLDPNDLNARDGLLQAFRARSPLYRVYLRYCFFMERLNRHARIAVIIGLWLAIKGVHSIFTGQWAPLGIALVVLYFLFILWVWVAKGVGNFFLIFDRFARHALSKTEKVEALFTGGGVLVGLTMSGVGWLINQIDLMLAGLTFVGAAFPMALVFTNASRVGRWLFGALGVGIYLTGFFILGRLWFYPWVRTEEIFTLFQFSMILAISTTWLGNIKRLKN
jgi:tetratricopeptide (TPR) repeat protein